MHFIFKMTLYRMYRLKRYKVSSFPETIKRGQILFRFILELPDVVYITYSDGTSIYYKGKRSVL